MSASLEPITAENEQAAVEAFGRVLRVVKPHAKLVGPDANDIPIPDAINKVLEQVVPLLASDHAVSIVPVGHLLTTQEAAEMCGFWDFCRLREVELMVLNRHSTGHKMGHRF